MILTNNYNRDRRLTAIAVVFVAVIVASLTQAIFGGAYYYHFAISFGYGASFAFLSAVATAYFPQWSNIKKTLVSTSIGTLIGTINMQVWIYIHRGYWKTEFVVPTMVITILFAFFVAYFFISRERDSKVEAELKDIRLRQAEQEKALIDSQLRHLQGQMEPHFLFNTLANIQILIDTDAQKAKKLLEKITDLLRAALKQQRKETISVADEIKLLDSYLTIQQIRLPDRMGFNIHLDDTVSSKTQIPPFLIQPAVENAVVHGIEPSVKGGYVDITFTKEGPRLVVEVNDNGIGFNDASKGNGLSMNNVKKRLDALYDENASLELIPHEGGGFTTRISFVCEQ